jgi:Arc/MetJ-type ribon-helix-helix transcriptional regulator
MSTQITVRLPEKILAHIDKTVASGEAKSRADVIIRAMKREERRQGAERDALVLARLAAENDGDPYPELAGLTEYAARNRPELD